MRRDHAVKQPDQQLRPSPVRVVVLWVLLAAHVAAYVLLTSGAPTAQSGQMRSWFLLQGSLWAAAIYCLVKNRPRRWRDAWIALALAFLVWAAYATKGWLSFNGVYNPLATFATALASMSALRRHPRAMAHLLHKSTGRGALTSVAIGLGIGAVLAGSNVWLGLRSGETLQPGLAWDRVLMPFSPAVYEEIANRTIFLAFAVTLLHGRVRGRSSIAGVWIAMSLPHLLPHLSGQIAFQPPGETIQALLTLFVLFSIPFLLLQRRRDITSAMIAHGLVDLVRFVLFDVPV